MTTFLVFSSYGGGIGTAFTVLRPSELCWISVDLKTTVFPISARSVNRQKRQDLNSEEKETIVVSSGTFENT